jgi:hypothetical protein
MFLAGLGCMGRLAIPVKKRCCNNLWTLGLLFGVLRKQLTIKSTASVDKCFGIAGRESEVTILYIAINYKGSIRIPKDQIVLTWFWYSDHGGFPVAISMTVHPTLQISAKRP